MSGNGRGLERKEPYPIVHRAYRIACLDKAGKGWTPLAMDWASLSVKKPFACAAPLLTILSLLYSIGVRCRVRSWRWRERNSLPGFVLSIGNLTLGGTGKTPAAMMLAEWALREGHRVAILSRGYKGKYRGRVLEVTDGHEIKTGPAEAGDEPFLMANRVRSVPVIISKKRYVAGMYAHRKFGTDFFILDDGFQHLALKRDFDLALMDALQPFGNGRLLPWGPLREPVSYLARADAFLMTSGCPGLSDQESHCATYLARRFPDKPVFRSQHMPDRVFLPNRKEDYDPAFMKGKKVLAFAGIARPERFGDTLKGLGAEVLAFHAFRDHHPFSIKEIRDLVHLKKRIGAHLLVTTEKDWVRIQQRVDDDFAYLTLRLELGGDFGALTSMIRERIPSGGGCSP